MKISKGIYVITELQHSLPRIPLVTIYKDFFRPIIGYGDTIYIPVQNGSFFGKLEFVQYKAVLAIAGAIQGSSPDKNYQEIGLEPLQSRRWYKLLSSMLKIMKGKASNYLTKLVPKHVPAIRTRNNSIPTFICRTDCFKYFLFILPLIIS